MNIQIDSLRFAWLAALVVGGASACSVAAEDGDLAAADDDRAEEAVGATSQAVTLAAPDLAAVLGAFYTIEIAEAQLALTKATDQHVREFAQAMLDHYTAANQELLTALQQLGLTPQDNPLSQALIERGTEEARALEGMTGVSFDWTYANVQIQLHRQMLTQLQEQILVNGVDVTPGLSHLVPGIRTATSENLGFATSLLSLMGTRFVPETRYPYGPPSYGNGTYPYGTGTYPSYGYGNNGYLSPYGSWNSGYSSPYGSWNSGYSSPYNTYYNPTLGFPRSGSFAPTRP